MTVTNKYSIKYNTTNLCSLFPILQRKTCILHIRVTISGFHLLWHLFVELHVKEITNKPLVLRIAVGKLLVYCYTNWITNCSIPVKLTLSI